MSSRPRVCRWPRKCVKFCDREAPLGGRQAGVEPDGLAVVMIAVAIIITKVQDQKKESRRKEMTAKEYLQQLWYIDRELDEKARQIEYLRAKAENCSQADPSGMPKGAGGKDKISDIVIRMVDLQTYISIRWDDLVNLREKITRQINGLKNPRSRIVLEARYLRKKEERSWNILERDLNYEKSSLLRIHRKALREFERRYPEIRKM